LLAGITGLAACGPTDEGTFVDPSGTASFTIRPKGELVVFRGR